MIRIGNNANNRLFSIGMINGRSKHKRNPLITFLLQLFSFYLIFNIFTMNFKIFLQSYKQHLTTIFNIFTMIYVHSKCVVIKKNNEFLLRVV